MKQAAKKIESPAWQQPAPGNEQNDSVQLPANETVKTGGNSRSAEDDLDLEKQPYRDSSFKKQGLAGANNELRKKPVERDDPDEEPYEQSF